MATLVNNTGTNANALAVNYDFSVVSPVTEEILGHRVYCSLTGVAGSWVNIPALDSAPAGRVAMTVALSSSWNSGAALYLL
jgi:hypothetical protein